MRGNIMTQPIISIGLQVNAFPIANVAVVNAVFGNTNEYQPIVKIIRPCLIAGKWAKAAMKKKKSARLNHHSLVKRNECYEPL